MIKHAAQGQTTLKYGVRQTGRVISGLFSIGFFVFAVSFALFLYAKRHQIAWSAVEESALSLIYAVIKEHYIHFFSAISHAFGLHSASNPHVMRSVLMHFFWKEVEEGVWLSSVLSVLAMSLFFYFLLKRGEKSQQEIPLRGVSMVSPHLLSKQIQKAGAPDFWLGEVPLPKDSEIQHFAFQGTTRTGKSNLMSDVLSQVRKKGQKALVYDKSGEYTARFYRPGKDIVLNCFDARCPATHVWSECTKAHHFDMLAEALIQDRGTQEQFWVTAARILFSVTANKLAQDPKKSTLKLLRLLLTSDLEQMHALVKNTEAETLMSDKVEKMALSVKAVLSTNIKHLKYFTDPKPSEKGFSIRDWVRDDEDSRWIFITSNGHQHATLKPIISYWIDVASHEILSLSKSRTRRIWMALDELPSLKHIPSLPNALAESAKFGACFMIGIQGIPQLYDCYGMTRAKEILGLLNTRVFFRSPDNDESAKLASIELGEYEVEVQQENRSLSTKKDAHETLSLSYQLKLRQLVLPSEISSLPNLEAYIRLSGPWPRTKVRFKYHAFPETEPSLIEAKNKDIETLVERPLHIEPSRPMPSKTSRRNQLPVLSLEED